jgi:hypothetical protein
MPIQAKISCECPMKGTKATIVPVSKLPNLIVAMVTRACILVRRHIVVKGGDTGIVKWRVCMLEHVPLESYERGKKHL